MSWSKGRYDKNKVLYSMDGKTLIKAPKDLKGKYTCAKGTEVIGEWAFLDCHDLTSIVLPETMKKIDEYAFCDCRHLESIRIPDSVTEISDYAFKDCGIKHIVIPNSVKKLSASAFSGCSELSEIVLPDTVKEIDLSGYSRMTSFVIATPLLKRKPTS